MFARNSKPPPSDAMSNENKTPSGVYASAFHAESIRLCNMKLESGCVLSDETRKEAHDFALNSLKQFYFSEFRGLLENLVIGTRAAEAGKKIAEIIEATAAAERESGIHELDEMTIEGAARVIAGNSTCAEAIAIEVQAAIDDATSIKPRCQYDTDGDGNCPIHPKGCPR